jgi:hypothetical protein
MKPIVTAATLVVGFGFATTSATDSDIASKTARSVIQGIILGGKVGPDLYGFVPANIESRVAASRFAPTGAVSEELSSPPVAQKRPEHARPSIRSAVPRRPQGRNG